MSRFSLQNSRGLQLISIVTQQQARMNETSRLSHLVSFSFLIALIPSNLIRSLFHLEIIALIIIIIIIIQVDIISLRKRCKNY